MPSDVVEYIGLTKAQCALVERFRRSPDETKSEIIERVLSPLRSLATRAQATAAGIRETVEWFDLGQGARLKVGEQPRLFLSEDAKRRRSPDAVAEIRSDGFYLDGSKITPSYGSVLQPAMRIVQERKNHRNAKGELISLSAWRQWYVSRDGKLVSILELKDPKLARRRGRDEISLEDLRPGDQSPPTDEQVVGADVLAKLRRGVTKNTA
jgi:hypothetical protein